MLAFDGDASVVVDDAVGLIFLKHGNKKLVVDGGANAMAASVRCAVMENILLVFRVELRQSENGIYLQRLRHEESLLDRW